MKAHNPQISNKEIRNFLASNEIFTRFKQHRKARHYSPIYVYSARELFQADVIFFTDSEMVKVNKDIDIYSAVLIVLPKWLGFIP